MMTMKKLAFLAVIALIFVACSKEQRQSRKMDGDWSLTTYNGSGLESGESETLSFSKDKKGEGTGSYTYTYDGESYTFKFDYKIIDENLTISTTEDGFTYSEIMSIKDLSKKELTLQDSDGDISVYEKK